jgi:hypothetical protein
LTEPALSQEPSLALCWILHPILFAWIQFASQGSIKFSLSRIRTWMKFWPSVREKRTNGSCRIPKNFFNFFQKQMIIRNILMALSAGLLWPFLLLLLVLCKLIVMFKLVLFPSSLFLANMRSCYSLFWVSVTCYSKHFKYHKSFVIWSGYLKQICSLSKLWDVNL